MIARPKQAYLEIFNDFGFNVKTVNFTTYGEADVYSTTVAFTLKNFEYDMYTMGNTLHTAQLKFNEKAQKVSQLEAIVEQ